MSLADSPPIFCSTSLPQVMRVSHAAGPMNNISAPVSAVRARTVRTTVLSPAGYSPQQPAYRSHCFRSLPIVPGSAAAVAVFDDTAHSAMNLVYMERDPGDASTVVVLASGGSLTAGSPAAYSGDSAQTSRFYGAAYSIPVSLGSTAGWDVLASASTPAEEAAALAATAKNRIVARDKSAGDAQQSKAS